MQNPITLSIHEAVGTPFCVASDDGQKIHARLAAALQEGRRVALSFHNVDIMTSAFLNSAIGQLYGNFDAEKIRDSIELKDIQPDDVALLKRVVENAKEYYKTPGVYEEEYARTLRDEIGEYE